ncbi:MAG: ABC transporter permease [Candidatus Sulfotelmatobacter sp.]
MRLGQQIFSSFRFALRTLAKKPAPAAVAVLALALGIGVNVSSFISVNAMVLHALPYPNLSRIVTIWETVPKLPSERDAVAAANFFDWKEQSHSFAEMAAYRTTNVNVTGDDGAERLQACRASADFFSVLGMNPLMGSTFAQDAEVEGRDRVAVISQGFWQRHFAGSGNPVGKALSLDGKSYTVVGVMPKDFDYPLATDVWIPLALTAQEKNQRSAHDLLVIARLKAGVAAAQAVSEAQTIAGRLAAQYPDSNEARTIQVVPLREVSNTITGRFVVILMAAAAFVLLLACANVSNIQLARAADRERELAIRTAVGASRGIIALQILSEAVVVALIGGVLGLLLASWNLTVTKASIPAEVLKWVAGLRNMRIDASVYIFALALSILVGVLCALPALFQILHRLQDRDLNSLLKDGQTSSSGPTRNRMRSAIVVAEVALALVQLVGAGAMVRAFERMSKSDPGYNPKGALTMNVSLPPQQYKNDFQITDFYGRVLRGLASIPAVKSSAAEGYVGTEEGLFVEGRPDPRPGDARPELKAISAHYFEAMQIPMLKGRPINEQDGADSPASVVISESLARRYWPNSDPLGERVRFGHTGAWLTVVGVSGDIKNWFAGDPMPGAYVPYSQSPLLSMRLLMRTDGDPMQLAQSARAQVREADPTQGAYDVKTMEQIVAEQTSGVRISARTMSMYALIALLLAVTGIYSVNSYLVSQRTYEIGVRMALGASPVNVLKLFLWKAARTASLGLAIGILLALTLTRVIASVLYNAVAIDSATFTALCLVLAASGLLAAYVPARRATKVDPMIALRHQ